MSLCDHSRVFSARTYEYLSQVFAYRLGMAEIGITDIFTFQLVNYYNNTGINSARIYKTNWNQESKYGSDIDLFIQRADGKYNRFALQAKVMSFNGAYKDLKLKLAPNQWDKLLDHENKFSSKSFYLFYNGQPTIRPIKKVPTRPDCLGIPSIQELGLGIVETLIVKNIRETLPNPTGQIYMRHFFPDHMDSIRKLFCCDGGNFDIEELKGYDFKEIYTGAPYKLIKFSESELEREEYEISEQYEEVLFDKYEDIAPLRIVIGKQE
jgi:hypothetical protein